VHYLDFTVQLPAAPPPPPGALAGRLPVFV